LPRDIAPPNVRSKPSRSETSGVPALHSANQPFESTSDLRVRYAETDQMGVVYHANYLVWCELGRTDLIRKLGKPYSAFEKEGVRLAVSEVTMRFKGSARYDDAIHVFTTLTDVRSRSVTFAYRIVHAERGDTLVTATTALIALDLNGRPISMPADMRSMLAAAITPAS
jgi:acyl-CoA thioester hydrolase